MASRHQQSLITGTRSCRRRRCYSCLGCCRKATPPQDTTGRCLLWIVESDLGLLSPLRGCSPVLLLVFWHRALLRISGGLFRLLLRLAGLHSTPISPPAAPQPLKRAGTVVQPARRDFQPGPKPKSNGVSRACPALMRRQSFAPRFLTNISSQGRAAAVSSCVPG